MRKNIEQYEAMLNSANEAAEAYLDMEGGEFLLSWIGELIQDLTAQGYVRSAALTVRKLCEAVDVEMQSVASEEIGKAEKQAWLHLFAGTLMERVKMTSTQNRYG